jgi:hypothetical protein
VSPLFHDTNSPVRLPFRCAVSSLFSRRLLHVMEESANAAECFWALTDVESSFSLREGVSRTAAYTLQILAVARGHDGFES